MDIVINILGILKYIGIGIIAFFAFAIVITITSNILRFLLDMIVFIIIAPFYILLHPIMFITKPIICFKNIFMKCPCFGEEYHETHKTTAEIAEDKWKSSCGSFYGDINKVDKYFEQQAFFFKETYGEDMFGNKLKK